MDVEVDPDNPFSSGVANPSVDEPGERFPMTSSRRGSEDIITHGYGHRTYGETSFITGVDDLSRLIHREGERDDAWARIKSKFPNCNPANSSFTGGIDEYDQVVVRLKRARGRSYPLFNSDGEVNGKLPNTIIDNLGQPVSKIVEAGEEDVVGRNKKIAELQDQLETASEDQREPQSTYCWRAGCSSPTREGE